MKLRITKEQVQDLMYALETNGHPGYITMAINALILNQFHSDYWKDIPASMKSELVKKVLQYTASTALRGTIEIDGLARSCKFNQPVSYSDPYDFTFTLNENQQQIRVRAVPKERLVHYYDAKSGNEICNMSLDSYEGSLDEQIELISRFETHLKEPTGLERERRNTGVGSGLWIGERPKK